MMDHITYMTKRNLIDKLNIGDIVIHSKIDGATFIIEVFDYHGLLVGIRRLHEYRDTRLLWVDPEDIIIANNRYKVEKNSLGTDIKKVIFNNPATIVFWSDGSKTVVKAHLDDYDPEKGLAMAIAKKALGNEGNYYNVFKKWLPKEGNSKEIQDRINKIFDEIVERKLEAFKTSIENAEKAVNKFGQYNDWRPM